MFCNKVNFNGLFLLIIGQLLIGQHFAGCPCIEPSRMLADKIVFLSVVVAHIDFAVAIKKK